MIIQNSKPIEQNQRTAIVDILRGWALLGVVLVNYGIFFSFGNNARVPGDDLVSQFMKELVSTLFATKCWTMLSFLFGYGFSVLIRNLELKGINTLQFFSRRMFWLFAIAFINSCIYYGDILKDYALMGMIILLFRGISNRSLLFVIIFILLLIPALCVYVKNIHFLPAGPDLQLYQSHSIFDVLWFGFRSGVNVMISLRKLLTWNVVMLACALMGQFVHKINFFEHLNDHKKYIKGVFWLAPSFAIFLGIIHLLDYKRSLNIANYYDLEYLFKLSLMVFIIAALCWLYVAGRLKRFFKSMQTIGKMTLTNYLVQNIIGLFVFSGFGFGLMHKMPYSYHILLALVVFILQIYFSRWWLSKYNYGPVEWIWRELTYRKRLIIKK